MRISAIIPTYNNPELLARAIRSVLEQTSPVEELIVVDDGSIDHTEQAVAGFGDQVRYIRQRNGGTSAARNRGAREARFEWLSFLDHDDEWMPRRIELHRAALAAKPEAALIYSAFHVTVVDGLGGRLVHPPPPEKLYPTLRLRNVCPGPVFSIRKDVYLELGGFRENLRGSCEDWDLFVRLSQRYPVAYVDEPLLRYYEVEASQSRKYKTMLDQTLSIVEGTLLSGLTGWRRAVWRRRILSSLYYKGAVGARAVGEPASSYVLSSLYWWPVPGGRLERLRTLLAEWRNPGKAAIR